MSGSYSGDSMYDVQVSGADQAEEFHGAVVRIDESRAEPGVLLHKPKAGTTTRPLIRSYRDGIRVGCTFITNAAIRRLYALHQHFLSGQDTKTHQEEK